MTDPATAEDRPEIHSPSADDSEVPECHAHQPRELTPAQEAKAAHELSAPMSDNQLKRFGELIEMHADYGHALSIAGERLLLEEATYWRRIAHEQDVALTTTVDRHNAALSELEAAQAREADTRAALERRLLQVKSLRSGGMKKINPLLHTTPVTTVEEEIEDARLWWQAVKHGSETNEKSRALGLGEESTDV